MNKNTYCPSCNSNLTTFIDEYKPLTQEDEKYFHHMCIYRCDICGLGFAHPMPDLKILSEYYSQIYRKPGRPHYIENPDKLCNSEWQIAQYSYISEFIDFNKIKVIYDIGPGYGLLLHTIRKLNKHITLVAIEPDVGSSSYLKKYNITTCNSLENIMNNECNVAPPDLIISAHSLEHFSDPNIFFTQILEILPQNGKLFLEVPNCQLTIDSYLPRPYDGPHLLFFTIESLIYLTKKFGLKIEHINTAGKDYPGIIYDMQKQLHNYFYPNFLPGNLIINSKFNQIIKISLKRLSDILKCIFHFPTTNLLNINPFLYGGKRWTIRAMISRQQ